MVFRLDNLLPELDLDVVYRFDLRSMSKQLIEHSKLDEFFSWLLLLCLKLHGQGLIVKLSMTTAPLCLPGLSALKSCSPSV